MAKNDKIIKYRRTINFDIGFIIFFMIIIYVLYNLFTYITSSPVTEYEVTQGSIATNNTYRGFIIRDETVVNSPADGIINYYKKTCTKASVNDVIYSIDTNGTVSDKINSAIEEGDLLSSSDISSLSESIDQYMNTYNSEDFTFLYSFKDSISSELTQALNTNALSNISSDISSATESNTFSTYKSATPGIITYTVDNLEGVTVDNFCQDNFDTSGYTVTNLANNSEVKIGDPVYKIINSEIWYIIISLTKDEYSNLKDQEYIKIKFNKDNYTINASSEAISKNGNYYLKLGMHSAMIRYIDERFIDIDLCLENTTGLKIPLTSITSKEFFTVPKEYFTSGTSSDSLSLLKVTDESTNDVSIINPTIYYETDDFYYIDSETIEEGDKILKQDSTSTYIIGTDKDSLVGVYNINKGYAVFRLIKKITANEEYELIESNTDYGVSLYDHIALDAKNVKENQTTTK